MEYALVCRRSVLASMPVRRWNTPEGQGSGKGYFVVSEMFRLQTFPWVLLA